MKPNPTRHSAIAAALALIPIMPGTAIGQTMDFGMPAPPGRHGADERPPRFDATLDSSYTAAGTTEFRGAHLGDSDALNYSLGLSARVPLNAQWIVPLALRSQNLSLGTLPGVPSPGDIHTLQFDIGLGYRPNDRWMFMTRITPTLYKLSDIGSNDRSASGSLMATWSYSTSLKYMFGVMVSPDSDIQVLPMVGAEWAISDQVDLRLTFPKPRLIYRPDARWRLHLGADMNMTTFRTSDSLGASTGLLQFNDALGTYRDICIGAGIAYRLGNALSVEVDAGYSVSRQIDYTRIDERVEFDPAPYAGIKLRLGF